MGYSKKIQAKHEERIRIALEKSKKEGVLESFKVAKELTTEEVTKIVRERHLAINKAILALDSKAKDYPQKKNALYELKAIVTNHLAITKGEVIDIQDQINKVLGINISN